jgi:transcriptional regulator with XRE-family HTH domain
MYYYPRLNNEIVKFCNRTHTPHKIFAQACGMSDSTLRSKRCGKRNISITEGLAFAHILRLPVEYLFGLRDVTCVNANNCSIKKGRPRKVTAKI